MIVPGHLVAGFALTLVWLWLPAAMAADTGMDRLNRFFSEVTTLEGDFRQEVRDERGKLTQESRGHVLLMRPGRFRWEYTEPYPQLLLTDGARLWIYDRELAQATVKPMDQALGAAPIALLGRKGALEDQFEISAAPDREGQKWVDLVPKIKDTEFVRIQFGLDDQGIRTMVLLDQFGQTTRIDFEDLRINAPMDAGQFRFVPPAGVDVIGEGG